MVSKFILFSVVGLIFLTKGGIASSQVFCPYWESIAEQRLRTQFKAPACCQEVALEGDGLFLSERYSQVHTSHWMYPYTISIPQRPISISERVPTSDSLIREEAIHIVRELGIEYRPRQALQASSEKFNLYPPTISGEEAEIYQVCAREFLEEKGERIQSVTKLGIGGSSIVFLATSWDGNQNVVKFRDTTAVGGIGRGLTRDLVLTEIFDEMSASFLLKEGNGNFKRLLEPVKYVNDRRLRKQGVLIQPFVDGVALSEIEKLIEEKKESALHQIGFLSAAQASRYLRSVQAFYHLTTASVVKFLEQNDLSVQKNRLFQNGNYTKDVGFDFNHGKNLLWDTKRKVFRVFDF